jgi:predicted ABC-class ATPase
LPGRDLANRLRAIDGRGYGAYKALAGSHPVAGGTLFIDHVQGDPFAAPSKLRFRIPMHAAALPRELFESRWQRIALADFLARSASRALRRELSKSGPELFESGPEPSESGREQQGSGRSGSLHVDTGGQEVLERSAVRLDDDFVELRLEAGLPARGRRVLGEQAITLLTRTIPNGAAAGLSWVQIDQVAAQTFVECVENQEAIRSRLSQLGLVAFVGNGSVLPRESGASDRPLLDPHVVAFRSPPELELQLELPNPDPTTGERKISGMGIPDGVTLIVGGGYHGKSTLLRAVERGVYPHVPGDGRERVVSLPGLVKIRAEDGRRVAAVDIHAFVDSLPGGRDTRCFSTENASGSTSQAASIMEAVEAGACGLLLDEDSSATNFMLRDARMQALVSRDHEPITPFIDRVQELYEEREVSSIIVMGGSGDYFDVADRVIAMRSYQPFEVSEDARRIAASMRTERVREAREPLSTGAPRQPDPSSLDASRGRRAVRLDVPERDLVIYGQQRLDLRGVEQLVDRSQTRAVAFAIHLASRQLMGDGVTVPEILDALDTLLDERGVDALDPFASARHPGVHPGNLARPRRYEIAAALNRLRGMRFRTSRYP